MKFKLTFIVSLIWVFISLFLIASCRDEIIHKETEIRTDVLIIYTTDPFILSGLGAIVIEEFESRYECTVILRTFSESGLLINHLQADIDTLQADLAIGILSPHIHRALRTNLFIPNEPELVRNISNRSFLIDSRHRLIPYNYDFYAFVYDADIVLIPPKTFGELQSSVWNDRIIMTDPRTSSIGMGAIMWSLGLFGDRGFEQFWISLRSNVVSIPTSLNEAYASFQAGVAPIILSYVSRPAYHQDIENNYRYQAFIPQEGRIKEVEYAGILNGAVNLFLARRFLEFMLSFDFQSHIPTTMWKFPVLDGVEMPYSLSSIQLPVNSLSENIFSNNTFFNNAWADEWIMIMTDR
ncbi:MAG: thiamine ABC transporter substrate-binding protein [Candidatus Cloacimonetes bacterium]|nr:thiamine ABC transporter substrate-binding protein [Candidatus Cloacimonadota bacterium]